MCYFLDSKEGNITYDGDIAFCLINIFFAFLGKNH